MERSAIRDKIRRWFDTGGRWKRIRAYFTHRLVAAGVPVKRRRNGEYALWQRRFWEHTIRNERDFERHVDYVHFNPAKHGLVSRVLDWPHSSFHLYVRRGVLPADWAGDVREPAMSFGERKG
jgi:putative transposase